MKKNILIFFILIFILVFTACDELEKMEISVAERGQGSGEIEPDPDDLEFEGPTFVV